MYNMYITVCYLQCYDCDLSASHTCMCASLRIWWIACCSLLWSLYTVCMPIWLMWSCYSSHIRENCPNKVGACGFLWWSRILHVSRVFESTDCHHSGHMITGLTDCLTARSNFVWLELRSTCTCANACTCTCPDIGVTVWYTCAIRITDRPHVSIHVNL